MMTRLILVPVRMEVMSTTHSAKVIDNIVSVYNFKNVHMCAKLVWKAQPNACPALTIPSGYTILLKTPVIAKKVIMTSLLRFVQVTPPNYNFNRLHP